MITHEQYVEAMRRLPLPALMNSVGLGEHTKEGARCPFHINERSLLSLSQDTSGKWRWKCDAGCRGGSEIDFMMKLFGLGMTDAGTRYAEMAGVIGETPTRKRAVQSANGKIVPFPKQSTVTAAQSGNGAKRGNIVQEKGPKGSGTLQGNDVVFPEIELWAEPVDGAQALDNIAKSVRSYVALPPEWADAVALWCTHAHLFDEFLWSPRLNISSPERGCGKSTLRDVVALFVPRPLPTENLSVAVLFRLVHAQKPIILADEYEAWLKENEELRGLLNAGHRRGAKVYRCEGDGHEVRGFDAYAPAVLCGIGALPGTLHDRSIVVRLERAKEGELSARFDPRHTDRQKELCRKLARWCADNRGRVAACDPTLPDGVFNRQADIGARCSRSRTLRAAIGRSVAPMHSKH